MATQVIKRDGTIENFDSEKVTRVLIAAGLSNSEATSVSTHISTWIANLSSAPKTTEIKDKIIELVTPVNPYVAGLYRWYEKTKDSSIVV